MPQPAATYTCFACDNPQTPLREFALFCSSCEQDLNSHLDAQASRLDIEVEVQAMYADEQLRKSFPHTVEEV